SVEGRVSQQPGVWRNGACDRLIAGSNFRHELIDAVRCDVVAVIVIIVVVSGGRVGGFCTGDGGAIHDNEALAAEGYDKERARVGAGGFCLPMKQEAKPTFGSPAATFMIASDHDPWCASKQLRRRREKIG